MRRCTAAYALAPSEQGRKVEVRGRDWSGREDLNLQQPVPNRLSMELPDTV